MFKKLMERVDRALNLFERSVATQEEIADQMDGVSERLDLIILSFESGSFYDMVSSKLDHIRENLQFINQQVNRAFIYKPRQDSSVSRSILLDMLAEIRPQMVRPGHPPNIGNHLARIAKSLELATNSEQIEKALKQNANDLRGLADKLGVPDANSRRR